MDLAQQLDLRLFREPRRKKAMARRAKTSHLGAFQAPAGARSPVVSRAAPRDAHDAVADCSTGFRAIARSERFLKARRAEDITEETLVVAPHNAFDNCGLLALVSGRVWRRLAPHAGHWRPRQHTGPIRQSPSSVLSSLCRRPDTKQPRR